VTPLSWTFSHSAQVCRCVARIGATCSSGFPCVTSRACGCHSFGVPCRETRPVLATSCCKRRKATPCLCKPFTSSSWSTVARRCLELYASHDTGGVAAGLLCHSCSYVESLGTARGRMLVPIPLEEFREFMYVNFGFGEGALPPPPHALPSRCCISALVVVLSFTNRSHRVVAACFFFFLVPLFLPVSFRRSTPTRHSALAIRHE